MHRNIEATVAVERTGLITKALYENPHVMGLTVLPGASVKPAGDVISIQVLNRGTDDVLTIIQRASGNSPFSIVTSETATIIDAANQKQIDDDVDEAMWEEIESGLRHNGRITVNFILLMAIGGIITTAGFVADTQMQVIAFISASIIAPGLEPLAKLPLGVVLRRKNCFLFGLRSSVVGYAVVLLSSIAAFYVLQLSGDADAATFLADDFTKSMQHMTPKDWIISGSAASASIIMYLSYRRNVIAGPLIALILIPATSGVGISMLLGEWTLAGIIAGRLGIEVLLTIVAGAFFIYLKQKTVHRRAPIV